jgi:hypothetical protein
MAEEDRGRLWNQALVSVYFWAQERTEGTGPPDGVPLLPMGEAMKLLADETDEGAQRAFRLAYVEAMRVFSRLDESVKSALRAIAAQKHLPTLPEGDDHREDESVIADVLSQMGAKRAVTSYLVRRVKS